MAIDKLDKIGIENVNKELAERGLTDEAIAKLQPILALEGSNAQKLETIGQILSENEVGTKGIEETRTILELAQDLTLPIELDLTLARGLNYYTGVAELNLYPASMLESTQVLFAAFGEAELRYALGWAKTLREQGLRVEVYPEPAKMKKQMGHHA